jgi:magnesium transporter
LLLSYPHDSAGGLMTTDFVIVLVGETVSEALTTVKAQLLKPDLVYYIYIVDNAEERHLRGVLSLRDLLLANPKTPLHDHMQPIAQSVQPERHCKEVAQIMGEYNLLALPVTDKSGRMLGLVTADDVLDLMLPEPMRQHLPRLFS